MATVITENQARAYKKLLVHEHLDCSVRPEYIVRRAVELGVKIPPQFVKAWKAAKGDPKKQASVAADYQTYAAAFAGESLANYVTAIVNHVLPVMQTQEDLYNITKQRIQDAIDDGVVGMLLRFAPQLHRQNGLTYAQVMEPVIKAVEESPIPVKLIVCALRHENGRRAQHLANLCIKYRQHVAMFDLAGDEASNPGVLPWWLKQALRAREHGVEPTIHLWETNEPTDEDVELVNKHNIQVLGHGFRGHRQGKCVCTVCVTSNIVTGQVACAEVHPINDLYQSGVATTIDTDGTLFTRTTATNEYLLLNRTFGWGAEEFLNCNLTALEASPYDEATKRNLERILRKSYSS